MSENRGPKGEPLTFFEWLKKKYGYEEAKRKYEKWKKAKY